MPMDLGMKETLLYDSMHCTTAVSLEMSDEPDKSRLHAVFYFTVISVTPF